MACITGWRHGRLFAAPATAPAGSSSDRDNYTGWSGNQDLPGDIVPSDCDEPRQERHRLLKGHSSTELGMDEYRSLASLVVASLDIASLFNIKTARGDHCPATEVFADAIE